MNRAQTWPFNKKYLELGPFEEKKSEILIFGRTLVNKRFQDPVVRAIREIEIPMFVYI